MCERDFVWWLVDNTRHRTKRVKSGGRTVVLRFYDFAYPPPDREEP